MCECCKYDTNVNSYKITRESVCASILHEVLLMIILVGKFLQVLTSCGR